jgi:2,3-bisphosphoglycerate-independent phosphoglycerate mutase
MKYIVLIGDGMSDVPLRELKGKTPLEAAKIPNMDFLAANGITGWVRTIPKGMPPGSDVANLSVFGYDPRQYYTGRGPLEAASLDIELKESEVAFRCNLVTIEDEKMKDYSAEHITTQEAKELIETLNVSLGKRDLKFYTGVSYRHILVVSDGPRQTQCTPPHDISGKAIEPYLPKGDGESFLRELMMASREVLEKHPVNKKRMAQGKRPANMIWLWGQGVAPNLPNFEEKHKISGSVISAVDLVKGIGKYLGLDVINVPGATGYLDTNYLGKAEYALKSLTAKDFCLVHVEAPDEASHEGDVKAKIKAIEDFDEKVVGTILKGIKKYPKYKILLMPDHPTPISLKTHSPDPVPFAIYSPDGPKDEVTAFNEKAISASKLRLEEGYTLMDRFVSPDDR